MKRLLFFVYLLLILRNLIYGADYLSSKIYSKEEISYIEKLQNASLKLGAHEESWLLNKEIIDDSLIYDYKKLIEDFFYFNIEIEVGSWEKIFNNFQMGKIDILPDFVVTPERKKKYYMTIPIFEKKIYINTKNDKTPLSSWIDLEGKEIAVLESSYSSKYLELFRKNNHIDFKIKEVSSILQYDEYDYIVFPTDMFIEKFSSKKLEIGEEEPMGIGISKRTPKLKEILDKALKYKLKNDILELRANDRKRKIKKNYYKLLTPSEKDFLDEKIFLEVYYQKDYYPISYYDEKKGKYDGILVRIVNQLSEILDKPIKILNKKEDSWHKIYSNFQRGEGDFLPMYFTFERAKKYNFSKTLEYKEIFLIKNTNQKHSELSIIGVIKSDLAEDLLKNSIYIEKK